MKAILTLLMVTVFFMNLGAQTVELTGSWSIVSFSTTNQGQSMVMDEKQLKEEGAIWDFYFGEDGKFSQTSNMAGDGRMGTWEGAWDIEEDNLIIKLIVEGREMEIVYHFKLEDGNLTIERSSPDGSWKMTAVHRKRA